MSKTDFYFMDLAIEEAKKSIAEGGIPIGSILTLDDKVIAKGHNKMLQENSPILHGEIDAINNAGLLNSEDYKKSTLYTTLSPCPMCAGAIIMYNIPKVVIGENTTLKGAENLLKKNNVEVVNLNLEKIKNLFEDFQKNNDLWQKELERVSNSTEIDI
ncbi:nucleoside deaminase [Methanobrevibacter sp. DSM 116169]|uniref:nucleoside deaminase n=1 Tax=Methanobrevibacter sp. DSM 116169 TaxID=3242727 RepID=UPI0038FC3F0F